jgi:hypothetical protein
VFDQIEQILKRKDLIGQDKYNPDFKAKEWNPELKRRYYQHFDHVR